MVLKKMRIAGKRHWRMAGDEIGYSIQYASDLRPFFQGKVPDKVKIRFSYGKNGFKPTRSYPQSCFFKIGNLEFHEDLLEEQGLDLRKRILVSVSEG